MKTVAIFDDSPMIRKQLKQIFEDTVGLKVVAEGGDGEEAVKIYKEKSPNLISLDLAMPNKDGLEAIEEIMNFDSQAKILVVSANKSKHQLTKAMHLGAKGFILKPLQLPSEIFLEKFKSEVDDVLS